MLLCNGLRAVVLAALGVAMTFVPAVAGTSGGNAAVADGKLGLAIAGRDLKQNEKAKGLKVAMTLRTPFGLATSRAGPDGFKSSEIADLFWVNRPLWADGTPILVTLCPADESDNIVMGDLFPGVAAALVNLRKRRDLSIAATDQDNAKDGTEVMAHSVLMPLYDPHNKLLGFGSLTHDMSGVVVPAAADPVPLEEPHEEHEQILVVDDDAEVRGLAERQLTSLGYRVIAVPDGARALEALASGVQIDLLFTDVVMPGGLNGREVAREARKLRPRLRVLFTSGYVEGALVRQGEIQQDVEFIMKPYRRKDLADKVRTLLSETAA